MVTFTSLACVAKEPSETKRHVRDGEKGGYHSRRIRGGRRRRKEEGERKEDKSPYQRERGEARRLWGPRHGHEMRRSQPDGV